MIRFRVTIIVVSLKEIAKIYRDDIWKIHRILKKILSNRGLQFASQFMKNLSRALETKQILSIAYHLQINSQIERINQKVEAFLWYYVNYQQDSWMKQLLAVEFQYNNKKYLATEYTPFELNFGQHLWKGDIAIKIKLPKLETFLKELQRSWKTVKTSIKKVK